MFQFRYIGKFDCLISKNVFENYVKNLYNNIKKCFQISWSPKKFVITMEIDPNKKKVKNATRIHHITSEIKWES